MDNKAIGIVDVDFKVAKKDDGTYDFTLSVPTKDRDGEIVDQGAFEPLPAWIPIDVDHGMTVLSTVGSGVPVYEGAVLKLRDFSFASTALAQDVKTLVDERHIRKLSVAFMEASREVDEKDGLPHVRKAELLNAAIVAISSNREADIALRAFAAKVGARNSATDSGLLQSAHDAIVAAGASCESKAAAPDDTKTATDPEPAAASAAAAPASVTEARFLSELAAAEVALL